MKVMKPGTACVVKAPPPIVSSGLSGNIPGFVNAVAVYGNGRITYLVSWWDGKTRKSEWLESHEVREHKSSVKMSIGF